LQKTRRYKVISLDNYHNSLPACYQRIEQLSRSELPEGASDETTKIDIHKCDLINKDEIKAVFDKYGRGGIWGVIHIGVCSFLLVDGGIGADSHGQAYKAVGESTEIPLTYYHNNVAATLFLLQVMAEYDCTRIVYSSSATVYGTPPNIPIPESTRLLADSPYGKTKVMSETIINDLCEGTSSQTMPESHQ
jgi:UDP-glucose 4-epimerase